MNETQVKTFLTAAEFLNFTEASYRLCTAQSAVSRTISAMEREPGYPLFIRLQSEVPQQSVMIRSVCLAAGFDPVIREAETRSDTLLWVETGRGIGVFTEYDFACFGPLLEKRAFPEPPLQNPVPAWCPRNTNPLLPEIVGRVYTRREEYRHESDAGNLPFWQRRRQRAFP